MLLQVIIPPTSTKLKGGYTGITLSVCPSVRPSVCPSVDKIVSALYLQQYSSDPFHICTSYQATKEGVSRVMPVSKFKNLKFWRIFIRPSINLWFVLSYLIKYAHNSIISDFSIFGIHRVIFLVRVFKFCTFWELVMFLDISSVFYRIPIWLFFTIILTIHLLISLGTLLARENIEGTFWFFSNSVCTCS